MRTNCLWNTTSSLYCDKNDLLHLQLFSSDERGFELYFFRKELTPEDLGHQLQIGAKLGYLFDKSYISALSKQPQKPIYQQFEIANIGLHSVNSIQIRVIGQKPLAQHPVGKKYPANIGNGYTCPHPFQQE